MELRVEDFPYRLKEELINFLYITNTTKYKDFNLINHHDMVITPVPMMKSLFDKANFYNICLQKLFFYCSNDHEFIIQLGKNLFSKNEIISSIIKIAEKHYNIVRRFKTPFAILNRNDYSVDKNKKFIFMNHQELFPYGLQLSDSEFYSNFSKKYPSYFEVEQEVIKEVSDKRDIFNNKAYFYDVKSSTRLKTIENISQCIVLIMQIFIDEFNKFSKIKNKDSFLPKDRAQVQEELHLKQQSEEGHQDVNQITEKDEIDNEYKTLIHNEAMILFVCKEENEENRLEQLSLINYLYSTQYFFYFQCRLCSKS